MFTLEKKDDKSHARMGELKLAHGEVATPVFMPVGTNGPVKTFLPHELKNMDIQIMLSNAYHLYLRPGIEVIEKAGGLHKFGGWDGNILTDSGGFQVFSLSKLTKIKEDGIEFRSHIDGSKHYLTPEAVVDVQRILGSDIMMVLDHCTASDVTFKQAQEALETTTRWAKKSRDYYHETIDPTKQKQFGIIQGNFYKDLRAQSVDEITAIDFDGYAIGGLSVGETKEQFIQMLSHTTQLLPENKPRYLMGVGTPEDLFFGVNEGIDMFDCVFPTRVARNGAVFTTKGRINILNEKYKFDQQSIDPECDCEVCANFSRSYIRHLFKAKEISGLRMTSYHNIYFMKQIMNRIRKAISEDRFSELMKDFFKEYDYKEKISY